MLINQNIFSMPTRQRILLVSDNFNAKYNDFIVKALANHTVLLAKVYVDLLTPYVTAAQRENCEVIVFNSERLLNRLINTLGLKSELVKEVSCNVFAGSVFEHAGLKWICVYNGKQLAIDKSLGFCINRFVDKCSIGLTLPEFNWEFLTVNNFDKYYELFKKAVLIAVDIETTKKPVNVAELRKQYPEHERGMWCKTKKSKNSSQLIEACPAISMCGYAGLFINDEGKLESFSVVCNLNSMAELDIIRKFNRLPAPKVMHNGAYDSSYFIRFNAPLFNYLHDSFQMMHAWLAELPRTLAFTAAITLPNYFYWKDESSVNMAEYNAKDCYNTLWAYLMLCQLTPTWAKENYYHKFRMIFPNLTGGLDGMRIDWDENDRLREVYTAQEEEAQSSLNKITGCYFNPNSPKQVPALMNALSIFNKAGMRKWPSSDKKNMQAFAESHPLADFIITKIKLAREASKKISTFINLADFDGRLLFEVNSSGTDTARAASKSSNFWCGTQVQNMDNKLRSQFVADFGWELGNCDGSQAESRTTAYLSDDCQLIKSVEEAPDFHSRNASLFFGIPENEIYLPEHFDEDGKFHEGKCINKAIRTLSKRVNHGANYNMGARVLLDTMGAKAVIHAKELLGLPSRYSLLDVCKFLLLRFEHTYPVLKGEYYDKIIQAVNITHMLVAPRTKMCAWTRHCFNYPISRTANKLGLNSYIAHPSQNLSAMNLDDACFDIWYQLQIKENKIRYKAQIHDECLYQTRPADHDYVKPLISSLMSRPITMATGKVLVIPNDRGGRGYRWSDLKD